MPQSDAKDDNQPLADEANSDAASDGATAGDHLSEEDKAVADLPANADLNANAEELDPDSDRHRECLATDLERDYIRRLRELELELQKTRNEAEAARLEARAAELELRIERLSAGKTDLDHSQRQQVTQSLRQQVDDLRHEVTLSQDAEEPSLRVDSDHPIASWDQLRHSLKTDPNESQQKPESPVQSVATGNALRGEEPAEERRAPGTSLATTSPADPTSVSKTRSTDSTRDQKPGKCAEPKLRFDGPHVLKKPAGRLATGKDQSVPDDSRGKGSASEEMGSAARAIEFDDETSDSERPAKGRPVAWMTSAIAHLLILILLGLFTLSTSKPGDQVAIAGSMEQTDEVAIESIQIETPDVEVSESTPTPSETAFEISEFGEMAITDVNVEAPPSPPSPLVESMMASEATSKAMMSLKSDSAATMKFCGVEGGGNHFVYLVDSSGSMGDAFESARRELLQSIEALKSDQRFYVVFFDAEPDYMRLSSPNEDESRSVYASPENKRALRQWAMSIKMDRGRAPWDPLRFAIDLRPDVVFLLSDGEFPQSIEDLLNEINRVDNLFGDDDPISIVHTIGYHSREGESRMRRIAKQHGGQYRHVPKP